MTDVHAPIAETAKPDAGSRAGTLDATAPALTQTELVSFVELLFFAYRDFTGEADAVLFDLGLGRAHHRVLHFVNRHPGLRVIDLLDILKITKQSLARVLKTLVDDGFIEQRAGRSDRRERLLFTTEKGRVLAWRLSGLQAERVRQALADAGPGASEAVKGFLSGMIAPDERAHIGSLLTAGSRRSEG